MKVETDPTTVTSRAVLTKPDRKVLAKAISRLVELLVIEGPDTSQGKLAFAAREALVLLLKEANGAATVENKAPTSSAKAKTAKK